MHDDVLAGPQPWLDRKRTRPHRPSGEYQQSLINPNHIAAHRTQHSPRHPDEVFGPHGPLPSVIFRSQKSATIRRWRPCRRLRGHTPAHLVPAEEQLGPCWRAQRHHSRLVAKYLAHGCRRAELGPVPLDLGVQVELTPLDEQQRTHGDERLAHRIRLDNAVPSPSTLPRRIRPAALQVNQLATVSPHGEVRPSSGLSVDHLSKCGFDPLETARDEPVVHRCHPPISMRLGSSFRLGCGHSALSD